MTKVRTHQDLDEQGNAFWIIVRQRGGAKFHQTNPKTKEVITYGSLGEALDAADAQEVKDHGRFTYTIVNSPESDRPMYQITIRKRGNRRGDRGQLGETHYFENLDGTKFRTHDKAKATKKAKLYNEIASWCVFKVETV